MRHLAFYFDPISPFAYLAFERLPHALACAPEGGTPSRFVCEQVFRHVWRGGGDPSDGARLAALAAQLAPLRDPAGDAVSACNCFGLSWKTPFGCPAAAQISS